MNSPSRGSDSDTERLQATLKEVIDLKTALDEHAIVAITDPQGRIKAVNDKFCAISKFSRAELVGQDHRIINSGCHPAEFFRELWATIGRGQVWRGEIKNRAKDGSFYWVDTTIVPFLNEHGRPREYVAIRADITQRKLAEEALRASTREVIDLKSALDEHAIVAITDPQGRITTVNDKFCAISKFSRAELIGQDHRIINSGYHPPEFFRELWSTIGRGQVWRGEIKNRAKDGSFYWVDTTIVPFLNDFGRPRLHVAIRADITQRKASEETNAMLAAIVESSEDAVIRIDTGGIIQTWNSGAQETFGHVAADFIGKSILHLVPEEQKAEEQERLAGIRRGGKVPRYESVRLHCDGRHIYVMITLSAVRDQNGRVLGASVIMRDITERKKLESQFLRTQRMEAIGTLAGGVAHDLNNLLSPMLMARAILRDSVTTPNEREVLEMVHKAARRASAIVKQLLAFSRGQDGVRVPVQPAHLFREIGGLLQETFPKEITITFNTQRNLWTVQGEPTQIHQVLMNLCVNARDAMPQGGHLSVSAQNVVITETEARANVRSRPGPYVLMTVADNGVGIPPDMIERIFDPFFTTKGVSHGTGLGLSTVAGIVKSHGGFVRVFSEVGDGAAFSVYLPATPDTVCLQPHEEETQVPGGQQELILVVDDEYPIVTSLRQLLTKHGYRVLTAENGREGLEVFRQHADEISLVITDTMMPHMGGVQFARELRVLRPELTIIASTGLEQDVKRQQYAEAGVPDVMLKPWEPVELLRRLAEKLAPARAGGPAATDRRVETDQARPPSRGRVMPEEN